MLKLREHDTIFQEVDMIILLIIKDVLFDFVIQIQQVCVCIYIYIVTSWRQSNAPILLITTRLCVYMCVYIYVMYIHIYICVCAFFYVCAYICVYIHVVTCVCIYTIHTCILHVDIISGQEDSPWLNVMPANCDVIFDFPNFTWFRALALNSGNSPYWTFSIFGPIFKSLPPSWRVIRWKESFYLLPRCRLSQLKSNSQKSFGRVHWEKIT